MWDTMDEFSLSLWDYLIDPLFLVLACTLAGMLWAVIPFPQRPQTPLSTELMTVESQEQAVAAAIEQADTEERRLREEAERLAKALQTAMGHTQKPSEEKATKAAEAGRPEQVLREKRAQVAHLQKTLQESKRPHVGKAPGAPEAVGTGKRPVFFELVHNRVVPVTDAFYRSELLPTDKGGTVRVASRTGTGESVEEFPKPSSHFMKVIQEIQPDKGYVALILHPDSFSAFRAVREVARQKGLEVGWEPYVGKDGKLYFSSGGRAIAVQR